jgi:hypothetical protein
MLCGWQTFTPTLRMARCELSLQGVSRLDCRRRKGDSDEGSLKKAVSEEGKPDWSGGGCEFCFEQIWIGCERDAGYARDD